MNERDRRRQARDRRRRQLRRFLTALFAEGWTLNRIHGSYYLKYIAQTVPNYGVRFREFFPDRASGVAKHIRDNPGGSADYTMDLYRRDQPLIDELVEMGKLPAKNVTWLPNVPTAPPARKTTTRRAARAKDERKQLDLLDAPTGQRVN